MRLKAILFPIDSVIVEILRENYCENYCENCYEKFCVLYRKIGVRQFDHYGCFIDGSGWLEVYECSLQRINTHPASRRSILELARSSSHGYGTIPCRFPNRPGSGRLLH